jgi:8-oxo-dGTP pyrophosphatase MutT (NUDIX family)
MSARAGQPTLRRVNARSQNSSSGGSTTAADTCAATHSRRRVSGSDRTEIVLAVLRRGDRIRLARRSEQVATSRGLWSVVTGYVEPGVVPLAQARQELEEELGPNSADLRLVRTLSPVALTSTASGKRFRVYPFLIDGDSDCEVVLNWEHTEQAWVEPARLADCDCVAWQRDIIAALLEQLS